MAQVSSAEARRPRTTTRGEAEEGRPDVAPRSPRNTASEVPRNGSAATNNIRHALGTHFALVAAVSLGSSCHLGPAQAVRWVTRQPRDEPRSRASPAPFPAGLRVAPWTLACLCYGLARLRCVLVSRRRQRTVPDHPRSAPLTSASSSGPKHSLTNYSIRLSNS